MVIHVKPINKKYSKEAKILQNVLNDFYWGNRKEIDNQIMESVKNRVLYGIDYRIGGIDFSSK